jgi:hypothetical protein
MLKALKGGIPEKLTWRKKTTPLPTRAWADGVMKTVGVPTAWAGGDANGDNANTTTSTVTRRTAAIGSLESLLALVRSNDRS